MAKVTFYLDTRKAVEGDIFPLVLNLAHKCQTSRIPIGMRFSKEDWEATQLMLANEPRVRWTAKAEEAYSVKAQYDVSLSRLAKEEDVEAMGAKEIRDRLVEMVTGVNKAKLREKRAKAKKSLFLPHYRAFMESRATAGTREMYNRTLKKMKEYDAEIENRTYEEIDKDWLIGFDAHLQTTTCANIRNMHFRNIRAAFNGAIDDDLTTCDPFRKFKLPKLEETRKRALTLEQIQMLKCYPCEPWQEEYRDLFMLQFYLIGVNLVDLLTAKPEDIVNGRFEYRRDKTHKLYSIKIEKEAMDIIEKYRGKDYLLSPMERYTNHKNYMQHMNRALQKIGLHYTTSQEKKGQALFPDITTYWSRHTWATVASTLDIPMELIGRALGHSWVNKTITSVYIDFDTRKVDDANRMVIDAVLGKKSKARKKKAVA